MRKLFNRSHPLSTTIINHSYLECLAKVVAKTSGNHTTCPGHLHSFYVGAPSGHGRSKYHRRSMENVSQWLTIKYWGGYWHWISNSLTVFDDPYSAIRKKNMVFNRRHSFAMIMINHHERFLTIIHWTTFIQPLINLPKISHQHQQPLSKSISNGININHHDIIPLCM